MSGSAAEIADFYSGAKHGLAALTGASEDLLHVHAGLLIFVVSALLFRRRMRSPIPLLLVAIFAAVNEVADLFSPGPQRPFEWLADFINTMFWPTLLFLIARRGRGSDRVPDDDDGDGTS